MNLLEVSFFCINLSLHLCNSPTHPWGYNTVKKKKKNLYGKHPWNYLCAYLLVENLSAAKSSNNRTLNQCILMIYSSLAILTTFSLAIILFLFKVVLKALFTNISSTLYWPSYWKWLLKVFCIGAILHTHSKLP